MRRLVTVSVLTTLAASGLLAGGLSAASAATAPAPSCDSNTSMFFCQASSPVSPVTWTITVPSAPGYSSTFSAPSFYRGTCTPGTEYGFSYSYVYGGATYTSPTTYFFCSKRPPT